MPDSSTSSIHRLGIEGVALLTLAIVAIIAAEFAHRFRELIFFALNNIYGERTTNIPSVNPDHNSTLVVRGIASFKVVLIIAIAVIAARFINRLATNWRHERLGLETISKAANGEGEGPSVRATLIRSSATLVASFGATSIGRESAILEAGGALGFFVGKKLKGYGPSIAAGGIAAAFAAAYHSPIGAVIYTAGHLGVWKHKRSVIYSAFASVMSYFFTLHFLGGHPLFPHSQGSARNMIILGSIALIPAMIGSRVFLEMRERVGNVKLFTSHPRESAAFFIAVSAITVAIAPASAGNGMEALRTAAVVTSLGIALAMSIGRMIAVTATLGAKVPGGVFAPSMSVAAGWAMLTFTALNAMGVHLPATWWDGMLVAMAVSVAISLRTPLLAVVVVAEMIGQMSVIPIFAVAVGIATLLNRRFDQYQQSRTHQPIHAMHDEDA